ncbi:MAG: Tfp pilus assembly protein PilN [Pirellulaceae bacterium]|jgi:Tfp pilus assembly protein PilN
MLNIEYLPSKYRQKHDDRKAMLSHLTVVAIVIGAIGLASVWQLAQRQRAQYRIDVLRREQSLATDRYDRHTDLKAEHTQLQTPVHLYSFLKHPWPTSRILNEIVATLPDEISLTQLTLSKARNEFARTVKPKKADEMVSGGTREERAKRDLELLESQAQASFKVVQLSGKSTSIAALHIYIAALNESRLIKSAKLESSQSRSTRNSETELIFSVSLTIEQPCGLPGALKKPATANVAVIQGGESL